MLASDFLQFCGWGGIEVAKTEWDQFASQFNVYSDPYTEETKVMMYLANRKVLGKDTPNYAQQIGDCFEAGTKILMSNGSEKNIEDILPNEYVITHKNRTRCVDNIIKKQYSGKMITIKLKGYHQTVTVTDNHEFPIVEYKHGRYNHNNIIWKKARDLTSKDRILMSFGLQKESNPSEPIDIFNYVGRNVSKQDINQFIFMDKDLAWLLGIYTAEGSLSLKDGTANRVDFNLNINETDYADKIESIVKRKFNLTGRREYRETQHVLIVHFDNVIFAEFFKKMIPGKAITKKIPNIIFNCDKETKLSYIQGWMDGDGSLVEETNKLVGVTSSHDLLYDMFRLSISCKIRPKTLLRKQMSHQNSSAGELHLYGQSINSVYSDVLLKKKTKNRHDIGIYGVVMRIKSLTESIVNNINVYCLDVNEDHSMIANGFAASNCVSFMAKNCAEYVALADIVIRGEAEEFKQYFSPYFYGTGRVFVGGGKINGDGSIGSWQAKAVEQYGCVAYDTVPGGYNGNLARKYGNRPGPPNDLVEKGKKNLIKTTTQVTSFEQAAKYVLNYYPVGICSNVGFEMTPGNDGFHDPGPSWAHAMTLIGVDTKYKIPYGIILNSWGSVHGQLKDFDDGHELPVGVLRVKASVIDRMLKQGDSFAYSQHDGFPTQKLNLKREDIVLL